MRKVLLWGGGLLAVAALAAYVAWPRPLAVETARCERGDIRVFISEEAESRLDEEYVVAMPVAGLLLRTDLEEGRVVEKGEVIARVDTFERTERLGMLRARVREVEAQIVGVDKQKPKPEEIRAAAIEVERAKDNLGAARQETARARVNLQQEEKQHARAKQLLAEKVIEAAQYDEAYRRYAIMKAECERARLNAEAAAKSLARAEEELKRIKKSVDDNEYLRSVYRAQIEQIRAETAVLEDELAKSVVRSPATGPVLEEYQEHEQVLPAGTPLVKIGDMGSIRIESDILSEEIGRLSAGQGVEIHGPAVGPEPVAGKIERIYPSGFEKISSLGIEQQRVKVIIAFDNSKLKLRPGVRVDVRIVTDHKQDALIVPDRALFKVRGHWHVFLARDRRAHLTPVEVGLRTDERAQILAPLQEGDTVILSPSIELDDGDRVAPKSEG